MPARFRDHEILVEQARTNALKIIQIYYPYARLQGADIRFGINGPGTGCSFDTATGIFTSFSSNSPSTDIVGFVCWAQGKDSHDKRARIGAFDWLREQGYGNQGEEPPVEQTKQLARNREERSVQALADEEAKRDAAAALYAEAVPIEGTPAMAYFLSRVGWADPPECLRYHSAVPLKAGKTAPALVIPVTGSSLGFAGIHYVFLNPEGKKLFSGHRSKRSAGPVKGAAMRFSEPVDRLYVCEGPEKGWALQALLEPSAAIWAVTGTQFMASLEIPDQVNRVVIMGDNDPEVTTSGDPFRPGKQAAEALASRVVGMGKEAQCVFPPIEGQDWDDMLLRCDPEALWGLQIDVAQLIDAAEVWRPEQVQEKTLEPPEGSEHDISEAGRLLGTEGDVAESIAERIDADKDAPPAEQARPMMRYEAGTSWDLKELKDTKGLPDEFDNHGSGAAQKEWNLQQEWVYLPRHLSFAKIGSRQGDAMSKEQFHDAFARQMTTAKVAGRARAYSQAFLNDFNTIHLDDVTIWPGKKRFVWETSGRLCLNLWSPSLIVPKIGNVDRYLEVIAGLTTGLNDAKTDTGTEQTEAQRAMRKTLSFEVQNPGEKLPYAIAAIGAQGIGKSSIAKMQRRVLGWENTAMLFVGWFDHDVSVHWAGREFVLVEEGERGGDNKGRKARIKLAITEGEVIMKALFKNPISIPNRTNFYFVSNHLDGVPVEPGERRFLMLYAPEKTKAHEDAMERFMSWAGGPEIADKTAISAVREFLLAEDLSCFDHTRPLLTTALKKAIGAGRSPVEDMLQDPYELRQYPFDRDVVSLREVVDYFEALGRRITERQVRVWIEERLHGRWFKEKVRYKTWMLTPLSQGGLIWQRAKQRIWIIRQHSINLLLQTPGHERTSWVQDLARANGHDLDDIAPERLVKVEDDEPYQAPATTIQEDEHE